MYELTSFECVEVVVVCLKGGHFSMGPGVCVQAKRAGRVVHGTMTALVYSVQAGSDRVAPELLCLLCRLRVTFPWPAGMVTSPV